jgi:hypothetical protein
MSLATKLSWTISGTAYTYDLKAETTNHSITRFAVVASLPKKNNPDATVTAFSSGSFFSLDLGMALEQITLTGVVDTVGASTTSYVYPSKTQLEGVCRHWWQYTNKQTSKGDLPTLTIDSGQIYSVVIKQGDFKHNAGLEDRWDYSITFMTA